MASQTVSGGIATFANLSVSHSGTGYVLTATANGLGNTASNAFTITAVPSGWTNVSSQVKTVASGLIYNPITQLFGGTIKLTNIGTTTLTGQLMVVLTGLPASVTLTNANGTTADGDPYILVNPPSGGLAPGQTVTFTVKFKNPNRILFNSGITTYEQTSGN